MIGIKRGFIHILTLCQRTMKESYALAFKEIANALKY